MGAVQLYSGTITHAKRPLTRSFPQPSASHHNTSHHYHYHSPLRQTRSRFEFEYMLFPRTRPRRMPAPRHPRGRRSQCRDVVRSHRLTRRLDAIGWKLQTLTSNFLGHLPCPPPAAKGAVGGNLPLCSFCILDSVKNACPNLQCARADRGTTKPSKAWGGEKKNRRGRGGKGCSKWAPTDGRRLGVCGRVGMCVACVVCARARACACSRRPYRSHGATARGR